MGIDKIFQSINEYLNLKKTHDSGDRYSFPLLQAKHEVENALIDMIDDRIKAYMGRERRKSNLTVATQSTPDPQKREVAMLDALNSAPIPPSNIPGWLVQGDPVGWMEAYSRWYYNKRSSAINGKNE